MKTRQLTYKFGAALVGAALTLFVTASASEARGHGGGGHGGSGIARMGSGMQFNNRIAGISQGRGNNARAISRGRGDDRTGRNVNDNRGLRRGHGADDGVNHHLNDDRGHHNRPGDDNNRRRRGRGPGG